MNVRPDPKNGNRDDMMGENDQVLTYDISDINEMEIPLPNNDQHSSSLQVPPTGLPLD